VVFLRQVVRDSLCGRARVQNLNRCWYHLLWLGGPAEEAMQQGRAWDGV
jgi:hypothetical protein